MRIFMLSAGQKHHSHPWLVAHCSLLSLSPLFRLINLIISCWHSSTLFSTSFCSYLLFCWITTVVDRFFWFVVVVVQYSCLLAIREKDEEEKWNWRPIRQQKISIRFLLLLLRHTLLLSLFLIFKKRNIDRIVFQWWIYDFDDDFDLIWFIWK